MKLLLLSDVHCSATAVAHLVSISEQVDIVVGAGDFGTMRRGLRETLAPFRSMGKPMILVPGNAESDDELREVADWETAHVLHGDAVEIQGQSFCGLGGGVPVTPFGAWSFDLTEEDAEQRLSACPAHCVLVTHSPPHGAVDVSSGGKHLGSTAIRDAIARCRPKLVVCGHIHDSAGRWESLDETMVVNAGPQGIMWDLDRNEPINS